MAESSSATGCDGISAEPPLDNIGDHDSVL